MFVSPFPVLEERRGGRKASQYLKPRKQEWFPGKSCSQSQHPRQREQHLRVSPAQDRSWLRYWSHSTSSQGNARTIISVTVLGEEMQTRLQCTKPSFSAWQGAIPLLACQYQKEERSSITPWLRWAPWRREDSELTLMGSWRKTEYCSTERAGSAGPIISFLESER